MAMHGCKVFWLHWVEHFGTIPDISRKCGTWWHYLESCLLVIGLTDDYAGWLPKDAWEWINAPVHRHAYRIAI